MNFCSQCGTRLVAGARFCSECGRAIADERRAAPTLDRSTDRSTVSRRSPTPAEPTPTRRLPTLREQAPGLIVLTVFLAAGLGIWVTVLKPPLRTASAPASPAAGATAPAGVPPDHPPIALPDEAKQFIASLAAKANAAPSDVGAWKTLAQVQARAAEIDPIYSSQALESYRHVAALAPDDLEAIQGLGNVFYDQQQYGAAAEQYERYLKAKPDDPSVRTDLATAYLYQRQVDRAVDTYKAVLATHPDFMQAHFNLGLAYEAKGEHAKAVEAMAKARNLAPDDATRAQIDRVTAELQGKGGAHAGLDAIAQAGPPDGAPPDVRRAPDRPAGGGAATGGGAPAARDFKGDVESALRAHPILGPKISAIEWPDPTHARVRVANFPMQAMPEGPRNLFRGRLETILDDAKTKHDIDGETAIELIDAASGATMERVTH